ncbi:MAG: phosphatase PAP2 family protein [Actinobacteria bacterium]|nr:MAG: phosphatase PAP2 family protein [Actinomycetota bacterium]
MVARPAGRLQRVALLGGPSPTRGRSADDDPLRRQVRHHDERLDARRSERFAHVDLQGAERDRRRRRHDPGPDRRRPRARDPSALGRVPRVRLDLGQHALVLAFFPAGERRHRWEWLAVGFAFVMSMSRVYLAAHWFSDVVAGTLLGAGIAIFWAAAVTECRDVIFRARGEPIPREDAPDAPVQAGK